MSVPPVAHPRSTPPQLVEQYRRAFRLLAERQDSQEALQLLVNCVTQDPGNLIFVETFLAGLKQRARPPGRFRGVMQRFAFQRAAQKEDWDAILRLGPELIWLRPYDALVLSGMARACQQRDFPDVALRYVTLATAAQPHDPALQRLGGVMFAEQGYFGEASLCWQRLLASAPTDQQAVGLLAVYRDLQPHGPDVPTAPTEDVTGSMEVGDYRNHAQQCAAAGHPQRACLWLEQGLKISPGDEQLREMLESATLQLAERHCRVARCQVVFLNSPAARELVGRLEEDLRQMELDLAYNRHRRWPGAMT